MAGSAEAALGGVLRDEGVLQRVRGLDVAESLDRLDGLARAAVGEGEAAEGRLAVHKDGAGTAFAAVATALGAGEAAGVAEEVEEGLVAGRVGIDRAAVHDEAHGGELRGAEEPCPARGP